MSKLSFAGHVVFLLVMWACSASAALAQSQSGVNSQTQSQAPPQSAAKSTAEPPPLAGTQSQDAAQPQEDSLAEAARKARAKKAKMEPAKVYTDENISGLKGGGVSVVGDGNSGGGSSAEYGNSSAEPRGNEAAKSGGSEEDRWRSKARRLLDQIAATDSEIKKVREEIEKYGNVGFDPSTGLRQNVIYVEDRNANLQKLESRKAELEKQMDALQEEGRKAGAEPSWFR
jgi:hypothetical protein